MFSLLVTLSLFQTVLAQADPAVKKALTDKRFNYTSLPYKVDTDQNTQRGPQFGYNICNSTTEGPNSLCQTAMINSADDFCLWGPSKPNSVIGDIEGEAIAWCTKAGRGQRIIPAGALTGVQFMKTPAYVQVVGFINQDKIDIQTSDYGGELDPHGYDGRGNPLGGVVFSNAFPSNGGNNNTFQQAIEWHNFMGGGEFCFKACDPTNKDAARFCQHIYDRVGCEFNAPNNAKQGVFESCQGDNQDFPGIYTQNGQVMTWSQPDGDIGNVPGVRTPKSSNCVQFQSTALYASATSSSAAASSTTAGGNSTVPSNGSTTRSGIPSPTSSSSASANKVAISAATYGLLISLVLII